MAEAVPAARPDAAPATRPGPSDPPAGGIPALARRATELAREAIGGEPALIFPAGVGPRLTVAATAIYVATVVTLPGLGQALALALVPLVLTALTMSAKAGTAVVAVTFSAAIIAEFVLAPDIGWLKIAELVALAAVSLALRLIAVRLARGRAELGRVAAELAMTQAQVDEARAATDRWVGQLEVAQRAAARMAGRSSVREVAEAVVDEIRAIVDYHACRVYVLEEPDELLPIVSAGDNGYETIPLDALRLKLGEGFTGWVAATGRPLLVPDAKADPRGREIPGTDDIDESLVVVPMRYDDRVTGAISLAKVGLHQFDLADVRMLSILADQAATAIESARAVAASADLADDLRHVADLSSALSQSLDPRQVAELAARHIGEALGADECAISHLDRAGDRLFTWGYWPTRPIDESEPEYPLASYPETRRAVETQALVTVDAEDPAADPAEVALLRRDGMRTLVMLPLVVKGESIGLVELSGRDVLRVDSRHADLARAMANEAAMALANAQLYETARALADRDPLTGFYNHRFLHERLGEEILRARRAGSPLALLMVDLDDFKMVNDTLGHLFGDEVLRWTAEQMRSQLRGSDVPARYGGDEFAVILPDTAATGAREVGERLVAALRERPFRTEGRGPVPISASIGVATFPVDGLAARDLIAGADAALYRVKKRGGRGVEGRLRRRLADPAAGRRVAG
jgi:diguanylate cyclase (GGDEF)-like protein